MKHLFTLLCWAVILGGLFAACTRKPKPTFPAPRAPLGEAFQEDKAMPDPNETILDFAKEPPASPIYFEYDSYGLKDLRKLEALADYLRHSAKTIAMTGYASQEGTDDYNLHLGARRAAAVRTYLEAAGIAEDRISWISLGEEDPVTTDPALYHLNRRVEFTLEDPK